MLKTAVVVCGTSNSSYLNDWEKELKMNNDDYLLCDVTNKPPPKSSDILKYVQDNVIIYDMNNLRKTFNFFKDPSNKHWWNHWGDRNIIWFYPHFRMLYFYKIYPNYDHYWFFDDDVTFPNGGLYEFVDAHKNLDHDCMITYIFGDGNKELQIDTLSMDSKMAAFHSQEHNWLSHYPGDGDIQPDDIKINYGSYFPLVRLSNDSLRILSEQHDCGCYGYSEGYVPTILNHYNKKLYSIYNKDSKIKAMEDFKIFHKRYEQMKWENL